jgi:transketolase
MITSYQELIKQTALADDKYIVMTAENRAVVRELPSLLGDRFIDVGITEQNMIGMAAGLALRGRVPICHALTNFLLFRAYEFIRNDVGIAHLPVKLSGWIPGFLSDGNGPTHQSLEDVGIMRLIPGMQVFCPSDNEDMLAMLPSIWASPNPSYVRVNVRPSVVGAHQPFEIGKVEELSTGEDVTIFVYGFLMEEVVKAKEILNQKGLAVGIVNVRSVWPFDEEYLVNIASKTKQIVLVEDHFGVGGMQSIVAEILMKHKVTANVTPINMANRWFKPGLLSEVLEYEGFTGEKIAEKILKG